VSDWSVFSKTPITQARFAPNPSGDPFNELDTEVESDQPRQPLRAKGDPFDELDRELESEPGRLGTEFKRGLASFPAEVSGGIHDIGKAFRQAATGMPEEYGTGARYAEEAGVPKAPENASFGERLARAYGVGAPLIAGGAIIGGPPGALAAAVATGASALAEPYIDKLAEIVPERFRPLSEIGAGFLIGGTTGKLAARSITPGPKIPTKMQVKDAADALYSKVDNSNILLDPNSVANDIYFKTKDTLGPGGPINAPTTSRLLNLVRPKQMDDPMDIRQVTETYKALGKIDPKLASKADYRAATIARQNISDYIDKLPSNPHYVMGGQENVPEMFQNWSDANHNWGAWKRADLVDRRFEAGMQQAGTTYSGGNIQNALRQKFGWFTNPLFPERQRGWTPDQLGQIKTIARGTPVTNTLRLLSRMAPDNALGIWGQLGTAGMALGTGNPGLLGINVGSLVGGTGARMLANRIQRGQLRNLRSSVLKQSPMFKQLNPGWEEPGREAGEAGEAGGVLGTLDEELPEYLHKGADVSVEARGQGEKKREAKEGGYARQMGARLYQAVGGYGFKQESKDKAPPLMIKAGKLVNTGGYDDDQPSTYQQIESALHNAAVATGAFRDPTRSLGRTVYDAATGAMNVMPAEAGGPRAVPLGPKPGEPWWVGEHEFASAPLERDPRIFDTEGRVFHPENLPSGAFTRDPADVPRRLQALEAMNARGAGQMEFPDLPGQDPYAWWPKQATLPQGRKPMARSHWPVTKPTTPSTPSSPTTPEPTSTTQSSLPGTEDTSLSSETRAYHRPHGGIDDLEGYTNPTVSELNRMLENSDNFESDLKFIRTDNGDMHVWPARDDSSYWHEGGMEALGLGNTGHQRGYIYENNFPDIEKMGIRKWGETIANGKDPPMHGYKYLTQTPEVGIAGPSPSTSSSPAAESAKSTTQPTPKQPTPQAPEPPPPMPVRAVKKPARVLNTLQRMRLPSWEGGVGFGGEGGYAHRLIRAALGGYDQPTENFADPEAYRLMAARQAARPQGGLLDAYAMQTNPMLQMAMRPQARTQVAGMSPIAQTGIGGGMGIPRPVIGGYEAKRGLSVPQSQSGPTLSDRLVSALHSAAAPIVAEHQQPWNAQRAYNLGTNALGILSAGPNPNPIEAGIRPGGYNDPVAPGASGGPTQDSASMFGGGYDWGRLLGFGTDAPHVQQPYGQSKYLLGSFSTQVKNRPVKLRGGASMQDPMPKDDDDDGGYGRRRRRGGYGARSDPYGEIYTLPGSLHHMRRRGGYGISQTSPLAGGSTY
jgi:hypothetical protein